MTGTDYLGWVTRELVEYYGFKPLIVEFPDLAGKARGWDASLVTNRIGRWAPFALAVAVLLLALGSISGGAVPGIVAAAVAVLTPVAWIVITSTSAVVYAFKMADDLTFAQIMAEIERLYNLVPKPGHLDVFEYYGGLVLVFEKPLPAQKRDALIAMRRTSAFARCVADIYVADLDAGTVFSVDAPWNVRKYVPVFSDVLGRKGTPPRMAPVEAGVGQRSRRTDPAVVSMALVALMAAIHVMVHLDSRESELLRLFHWGAMNTIHAGMGEYWRLITAVFLHANLMHLGVNMIALFEYGRAVEPLFGSGWAMAIFLVTGVCGNLLGWLVYAGFLYPMGCGVGASGAIFGFAGVLVSVYIFRRERLTVRFRTHFWSTAVLLGTFLMAEGLMRAGNFGGDLAHLGGFAAGFAIGAVLPFKEGPRSPWRGAWLGWGAAAAGVWAAAMAGASRDWRPANYSPVTSQDAAAAAVCPEGWDAFDDKGERLVLIQDWLGASVILGHGDYQVEGILQEPLWSLRERFEKMLREEFDKKFGVATERDHYLVSQEVADFSAAAVGLGGGKAVSFRYRLRRKVETRLYKLIPVDEEEERVQEFMILPRTSGYLWVRFDSDARDSEYYRPVLAEIRGAIRSLDTPAVMYGPSSQ
jgi:membrane associated rhomboid family serine protease